MIHLSYIIDIVQYIQFNINISDAFFHGIDVVFVLLLNIGKLVIS